METKNHQNNNPMGYAPPQPVKLPLAAILSTPPDIHRRPNVVRRGSSIFSPAHHPQTLDRHPHNPPPPPPPAPDPDPPTPKSKAPPPETTTSAKYKECLKNHAATMGAHVVDGCGEFMPDDENPLRCAACDCHRNFHRMEPDENPPPRPPGMVSFGGGGGAAAESSSGRAVGVESKKRFRTKFGPEQKERMQEFAAKVGWRMRKEEEEELRRFCGEVGVKREVFKVWMHNTKQATKRKRLEGSD